MLSRVSTSPTTPRGLSRRLTRYGDEGFARFLREAFLESAGLSRESFDRPVIGIASTASDFNPCHATAPELIAAIHARRHDGGRTAVHVSDDLAA